MCFTVYFIFIIIIIYLKIYNWNNMEDIENILSLDPDTLLKECGCQGNLEYV